MLENYSLPKITKQVVEAWKQPDAVLAEQAKLHHVYNFHVYYMVRQILGEISASLPQDDGWDPITNSYN